MHLDAFFQGFCGLKESFCGFYASVFGIGRSSGDISYEATLFVGRGKTISEVTVTVIYVIV